MKYVAALQLAHLGGNTDPQVSDIKAILASVGIECDDSRLEVLLKETAGKTIASLVAEGSSKLASMPAVGNSAAAPSASAASAAPGSAAPAKAAVKEESEEEEMGMGLFD